MSREELEFLVSRHFTHALTYEDENLVEFLVDPLPGLTDDEAFSEVYNALVPKGYSVVLFSSKGMRFLRVSKRASTPRETFNRFMIMLFATVASVAVTGYFTLSNYNATVSALNRSFGAGVPYIDPILGTAAFVAGVMTPLMGHELSHYIASRRAGVPVTYPLPIPAPIVSPVGTFGAFIRSYHPPKDVKSLALVGISGPLAGVLLSIVLYIFSYISSPTIPVEVAQAALEADLIRELGVVPSLTLLIDQLLKVEGVVLLSPIALAAWFLLLVHFANLMPIGQLDGGHVMRSLTNVRAHSILSMTVITVSIITSIIVPNLIWLGIFAVIALLISGRGPHYGAANTLSKLSGRDKVLYGTTYLILLFLTLPLPVVV
ncbi:MAG: site-2 protease family protein [Zestosphaera sp.]